MDVSQITESLYVAARVKEDDLAATLRLDPDLIISMIVQRRPPRSLTSAGLKVLWLRTFDFALIPIPLKALKRGVEAALPIIHNGGRVLIFCEAGRHRSVAMAACILIGQGYSADEAMQLISDKRLVADPYTRHIQRQIRRFEAYWREKAQNRREPSFSET
jgi:protein-tyrosine phosphatase